MFILNHLADTSRFGVKWLQLSSFFNSKKFLLPLFAHSLPSSVSIKFDFLFEELRLFSKELFIVCDFLFSNGSVHPSLLKKSNGTELFQIRSVVFGPQYFRSNKSMLFQYHLCLTHLFECLQNSFLESKLISRLRKTRFFSFKFL